MLATLVRIGAASAIAAGVAVAIAACGGGGGGYGGSNPTAPSGPSGTAVTVTIRAGGTLDPLEVRISAGQSVRFVNEDGRPRHPQSNPHLSHTDCPQANVAVLNTGQSATTAAFNTARVCGYHDHLNPDDTRLHGTIRIGDAQGPGGPVYVVHQ